MKNKEVAKIFKDVARILELKGENPFRIRAYEKASQNIESLAQDVEIIAKEGRLTSLPGIGQDLANKIKEIINTGTLKQYENLKKEVPEGLLKMLEIPGLGPKTVKSLYDKLKIDSIEKLEEAAKKNKLQTLEGIREKTVENILKGIQLLKKGRERAPLYIALSVAEGFISELKKMREVEKIDAAGSLRRKKETIKDVDILVVSTKPSRVMERFVNLPFVQEVLAHGETKSSVICKENSMQVDLRVVAKDSFGSALMYFTGSKDFNIKFRQLAIKNGFKVNEYGVFKKDKRIAGKTEEEIFQLMKMQYIPPELREDRGEIELALRNKLPNIIDIKDINGDLHIHSKYSDGAATIEEIIAQSKKMGYKFVGICDHSQGLKVAGGVSIKEVYKKIEHIKKLNSKLKDIKIICGTEVEILGDGSLDYPNSILKEFDLVMAAIHSGFKQSKSQLTKRIVKACQNRFVNVIAHPTGRLFGVREAYEVDWDQVFRVASDFNVALEINCYPQRLDLDDLGCMKAAQNSVKLCLGTDAHILDQMQAIDLGVSVARRGWLKKSDIINCWETDKLIRWLKK
jgi:DNA polymerase (family 10)